MTGQALISQIVSPISAISLSNLYHSDWPLSSLPDFAVDRLTRGDTDYGVAVNALIALDALAAVNIAPTASKQSPSTRSLTLSLRLTPKYTEANNNPACSYQTYYTVPPALGSVELPLASSPTGTVARVKDALTQLITESQQPDKPLYLQCLETTRGFLRPGNFDDVVAERALDAARRLILIVETPSEPPKSYVSYTDGDQWYYIDADDHISQKNFVLLNELLTIQATTPPPLPITPTVTLNPP